MSSRNSVSVDHHWSRYRLSTMRRQVWHIHYNDVIMSAMESQITSLTIVYSTVYSDEDQRKHQSSASLAFVRGIHRWPVNSPHKGPVTWKMFPFDVIMISSMLKTWRYLLKLCQYAFPLISILLSFHYQSMWKENRWWPRRLRCVIFGNERLWSRSEYYIQVHHAITGAYDDLDPTRNSHRIGIKTR